MAFCTVGALFSVFNEENVPTLVPAMNHCFATSCEIIIYFRFFRFPQFIILFILDFPLHTSTHFSESYLQKQPAFFNLTVSKEEKAKAMEKLMSADTNLVCVKRKVVRDLSWGWITKKRIMTSIGCCLNPIFAQFSNPTATKPLRNEGS